MVNLLRDFFCIKKNSGPDYGIKRIAQVKEGEDGITCVAMLLNYFGQETSIKALRKKYPKFLNITSVEELANLCTANNLKTQQFHGNYLEIKKLSSPSIIYWRMERFAVLLGVDHEKYLVFDPANERIEYQEYEVECYYCEIALQVAE